ncbi:MAG: tyrosine-type recombinase/integrase [Candidatus Brevundimonas colombiensis]|uniref:Tyrosine-type recombinase/integrase n=1 Tax=Candidatus Brevundimonas colombiensis TaxID=3121376 RepID=A0AAJ5X3R0_9CAUL|nr:site-specific integrase [Brevundimonas sp.]WEK40528.1 MAG: tyrosine-type recombinase/integrase [Brevundimonas sp.]
MPKAHLTQAFVANAGCEVGKKKTDWYDTTITGFVLECRSTGGKTYYLRYVDQAGRQKQYKIGGSNDVTFAAAKKKAQQLRSEVVMGGDPGAQKALVKSVPLYGELAAMHLESVKDQKSYPSIEMCMRVHIVPRWGKTRLTDINSRTVAQWLTEKRAKGLSPASVEKLRVLLGRSFVLGSSWDVPGTDKNPTRGLGKRLNNGRERFLSAEEAARLREAVAASQNPQLQHIVGLLLLTGARLRELLDARIDHVDIERRSWLIPTSKTGKPRHVPLSTAALAIIEQLPRFKGCPWLVPNPETRLPFVSIKHGWQRAIREAKLPGLRLHDLRHSAASFMVNSGVDLFAVGKVLGHASYQSTQRYSHLANDTLLKAVEAGAAKQAAF